MTFWFKVFHGMAYDMTWRLIANAQHTQVDKVVCIWLSLLDYASTNEDRGSIVGFDPCTCKLAFGYKLDLVERVIEEMTLRGVITEDNRIAQWDATQYQGKDSEEGEDPTKLEKLELVRQKNRERQARFRNKRKQEELKKQGHADINSMCSNAQEAIGNADSNTFSNVTGNASDNVTNVTDNAPNKVYIEKSISKEDLSPHTPQGDNVTHNAQEVTGNAVTHDTVTDNAVTCDSITETLPQPEPIAATPQPEAQPEQPTLSPEQPAKPKRKRTDYRRKDFDEWFGEYPNQTSEDDAWKEWQRKIKQGKLPEQPVLMDALQEHKRSRRWLEGYVKDPDNYLRGEHWKDKLPMPVQPQQQFFSGQQPQGQYGTPYQTPYKPGSIEDTMAYNMQVANRVHMNRTGQKLFELPDENAMDAQVINTETQGLPQFGG